MATPREPSQKKAQSRGIWPLFSQTFDEWKKDNAPRLAAELSFYAALSIAPLLVIAIAVAGLVLGPAAARADILHGLEQAMGAASARTLDSMIDAANKPRHGIVATAIGIGVLLFGASNVFVELEAVLNTMWKVEPKPGRRFWGKIRERFLSFTMVIVLAFLLLVALVLNSALWSIGNRLEGVLPGGTQMWRAITLVVTFAVVASTFALIFKFLPDVDIRWRDVWVGALFTAVLFTTGKFLFSLFIGRAVASTYGAAGSVMVLLIWVYYSSLIAFFGAELTQVYARMYGSRIVAGKHARSVSDAPPAAPGMPLPRT